MFKSFNDDDQIFMMCFSAGAQSNRNEDGAFGSVVVGMLAFAIVMMVFVGLLRESEQRRLQQPIARPNYSRQVW